MGIAEGRRSAPEDRWSWARDVGLSAEEIPTPALLLDIDIATANASLMGERFRSLSASLRPHVKAHKCAELARLQLDHGAIGVTTATLAEAEAMASAGVGDVLIANEVVGAAAAERLALIAASTRLTVAADDESNLAELGRRASGAGSEIGVLIEVDVGMGRGGASSP